MPPTKKPHGHHAPRGNHNNGVLLHSATGVRRYQLPPGIARLRTRYRAVWPDPPASVLTGPTGWEVVLRFARRPAPRYRAGQRL